jgi:DNA (cytosine-5)-methyltransferase 1
VEICAGAGGQAHGLESAGFRHLALVEYERACCDTLRSRPKWRKIVRELDLHEWTARKFEHQVDLFAGGVPCPPFSRAGRRLGRDDERDLFPKALELIEECTPRAVMLENVRGIMSDEFADYRENVINAELRRMGYKPQWKLLHAVDFGVPQLRPRAIMVALASDLHPHFAWPQGDPGAALTVGETLYREMASRGWPGARAWMERANSIAPTLVGGSLKHGGPDLGPTQAKKQWRALGVDGMGIAEEAPGPEWNGEPPRLTVRMTALLQGFPKDWPFAGRKTNQYRQVGNAFPPPVAEAVGRSIARAFSAATDAAGAKAARSAVPVST